MLITLFLIIAIVSFPEEEKEGRFGKLAQQRLFWCPHSPHRLNAKADKDVTGCPDVSKRTQHLGCIPSAIWSPLNWPILLIGTIVGKKTVTKEMQKNTPQARGHSNNKQTMMAFCNLTQAVLSYQPLAKLSTDHWNNLFSKMKELLNIVPRVDNSHLSVILSCLLLGYEIFLRYKIETGLRSFYPTLFFSRPVFLSATYCSQGSASVIVQSPPAIDLHFLHNLNICFISTIISTFLSKSSPHFDPAPSFLVSVICFRL